MFTFLKHIPFIVSLTPNILLMQFVLVSNLESFPPKKICFLEDFDYLYIFEHHRLRTALHNIIRVCMTYG